MLDRLKSALKNPTFQKVVLTGAGAAAGAYGGPAAASAVAVYLPKLAALFGL
jgi:hypothetical protein